MATMKLVRSGLLRWPSALARPSTTTAVGRTQNCYHPLRRAIAWTSSRSLATAQVADTSTSDERIPAPTLVRATSLGLTERLVQPYAESIAQLPEVASVMQSSSHSDATTTPHPTTTVESLQRAADIFASFAPGGSEHVAVLSLLAEVQQSQLNDYRGAQRTLQQIANYIKESGSSAITVGLALAKTLWMQGDFAASLAHTRQVRHDLSSTTSHTSLPPLHQAALAQAQLLGTLLHEGPLAAREAALSVDAVGVPPAVQALQCLNWGVMEALWAFGNDCQGDSTCYVTRYDEAKDMWQRGIDLLQQAESDSSDESSLPSPFALAVKGRLQSNMAYAVLQIAGQAEEHIAKASEHAREALQALEQIRDPANTSRHLPDEGWTRALTLVAQCYHRAGHAVTAEGLLQSALDETHLGASGGMGGGNPVVLSPPCVLERRAAYQAYAALCRDWEKRQGDAQRFTASAAALDEHLPGGWKDATELHASLWFWMPSQI